MKFLIIAIIVGLFIVLGRRGIGGAVQSEYPPTAEGIRAAIIANRKIEAIKLYRQLHGTDLKSSKEAVERIESELRKEGVLF
ncbi:MAG: hypothetical protein IT290_08480 [Deltaproteobacteria bacterium]|nr:hypothetical protein [Deltaproteobacteria bacterium]